ncbi:MAG: RpoL/Rpb11 RNA polymerase subunit family protein [Candidatus Bathycorpusculaceae bacterium]
MKVKVLKKTANELKIEVEGIGHGLCNLIQKKLLEEEDVDLAGYDIPHPLASNPIIYIRTKGHAKPEEVLFRALKNARKINKDFSREFEKALKRT